MTRRAVALAPAKINVGLEITGKRPDGFHDIVSILQTVSLYDRLEWSASQDAFRYLASDGIAARDDITGRALETAPDYPEWQGYLRLHKAIPIAAGLGGGSSDAALALRVAYPEADIELMSDLSASFGSDVPFSLEGGTSLATGTGTDLIRLPHLDSWCVIVTPRLMLPDKTLTLYASLSAGDYSDGAAVKRIAETLEKDGALVTCPPNAFTRLLLEYPQIRAARDSLRRAGAAWVSVSGAGPSLYTLVTDYRAARSIAARVPSSAGKIFVARTLRRRQSHIAAKNLAALVRAGSAPR